MKKLIEGNPPAKNLIGSLQKRAATLTPEPLETSAKERMVLLWKAMTAIYKNNWIDKYPVTDIPYWADELSDRTDAQIAWGLRHMKQAPNYETWPPNLLEFRKLCVISLRDL
ncbi:hypothetical protein LCGC14_1627630, partial [marine sediment metagenome]